MLGLMPEVKGAKSKRSWFPLNECSGCWRPQQTHQACESIPCKVDGCWSLVRRIPVGVPPCEEPDQRHWNSQENERHESLVVRPQPPGEPEVTRSQSNHRDHEQEVHEAPAMWGLTPGSRGQASVRWLSPWMNTQVVSVHRPRPATGRCCRLEQGTPKGSARQVARPEAAADALPYPCTDQTKLPFPHQISTHGRMGH